MTRRRARDPWTRMVVNLPERALSDCILDLGTPLLDLLGPTPGLDEARHAIGLVIDLWNAHVAASPLWGSPNPKRLATLRKAMCGKQAPPGLADTFALVSARWRATFDLDPRLVGRWSFEATGDGRGTLVCETRLPDGVEAHVPPPVEKRIAIGGRFLDEVTIRQSATSYLSFPVEHHCGNVGDDGSVTIQTKPPTVIQLFAEGRLAPVGGASVDLMVGGRKLPSRVLTGVRCFGFGGLDATAELIFRTASEGSAG